MYYVVEIYDKMDKNRIPLACTKDIYKAKAYRDLRKKYHKNYSDCCKVRIVEYSDKIFENLQMNNQEFGSCPNLIEVEDGMWVSDDDLDFVLGQLDSRMDMVEKNLRDTLDALKYFDDPEFDSMRKSIKKLLKRIDCTDDAYDTDLYNNLNWDRILKKIVI